MQNGLLQRAVYNKQMLITNMNCLLDLFHLENRPVFLFRHTNKSFSQIGTDEWQLYTELRQAESDFVINKTHGSVFEEKQFQCLLESESIDRVVIAGLVSNGCVQAACTAAKKQGLDVTLVSDAHSTWQKDAEKVIMDWNTRLAADGIRILATDEILHSPA